MYRNKKRLVPLIVWLVLIFGGSSLPALSADIPNLPTLFDKVAHCAEYFILAVLFHRVLSLNRARGNMVVSLVVAFVCIAIAALDETYQRFIPGRHSSILDFYADLTGVLIGTITAHVLFRRRDLIRHEIQETQRHE